MNILIFPNIRLSHCMLITLQSICHRHICHKPLICFSSLCQLILKDVRIQPCQFQYQMINEDGAEMIYKIPGLMWDVNFNLCKWIINRQNRTLRIPEFRSLWKLLKHLSISNYLGLLVVFSNLTKSLWGRNKP